MKPPSPIEILPFRPQDQEAAQSLILEGLGEHWGTLDPTKNPDLNDIAGVYKNDHFVVAWSNGKITGTGCLVHRTDKIAEVVRMSVAKEYRRQGIGRSILEHLLDRARHLGYKGIILETTEAWKDVIKFYLSFGFRVSHFQDGDAHFFLDLECQNPGASVKGPSP